MLRGSKKRFAIEYSADGPHIVDGRKWLFGHICFWVNAKAVGNYDEVSSLSVAAATMSNLLENRGKRSAPELMEKSALELFNFIYCALYIDDGRSDEQVQVDWDKYSKYLATPSGFEAFDGWKAFLVEDEHRGRYVWQETRIEKSKTFEVDLRRGEFDDAIESFLLDIERL